MNAAVIHQFGALDAVTVDDVPEPTPGDDEVVVEIRAAALNHLDIWIRSGRRSDLPLPHILGSDAAGVIVEAGADVLGFEPGDEVVLNPGLSCMACEACRRGQHSECGTYGIVGMVRDGTFAERVAVPAVNVYPKPEHLSWEEGAALPLAHLTAWRMLFTRGGLGPGETVLIHGIGGGVALAGLQLAVQAGAEVIVTSSGADKLEKGRHHGAAHTINYRQHPEVAEAVREITGGRGVDVVLDAVGAQTWPTNLAAARKGGRIVHCGVTTGANADANLGAIYWKQLSILGSTMGSHEDFRRMLASVSAAGLRPAIDSVHPLEQAQAAQGRMERGEQFGKIVLTP